MSRCIKKYNCLEKIKSLPRINLNRHVSQNERKETPSCIWLKASYTLEAAIIFPLVAGFIVFLLLFFRILQVQTAVESGLTYASRMTAVESCVVESEASLLASAEGFLISKLKDEAIIEEYVAGGLLGISLLNSDTSGDEIALLAEYSVKLPIGFFQIKSINLSGRSVSRKWIGDRNSDSLEDYVYVTEYGTVYHTTKSCPYLDLSIHSVFISSIGGIRSKSGSKYSACSRCAEEISGISTVYVTDYGTLYHKDIGCSALKRTIHIVPLSEVSDMSGCSKCGM